MAPYSVVVKPLDGAEGYLRWKESMLLHLHTVGVAHVLSEDQPPAGDAASAKNWARDNAMCRGHILAALLDRLFPDYVRHAAARDLWEAVERTYAVDTSGVAHKRLMRFEFDDEGGGPFRLLEQIAHVEALNAAMRPALFDGLLAHAVCVKIPRHVKRRLLDLAHGATLPSSEGVMSMANVWDLARAAEKARMEDELKVQGTMEDQESGHCTA